MIAGLMSAARTALEVRSARPNAALTPESIYADFRLIITIPRLLLSCTTRIATQTPGDAARYNGLARSLDQLVKTIAWLPFEVKRIVRRACECALHARRRR